MCKKKKKNILVLGICKQINFLNTKVTKRCVKHSYPQYGQPYYRVAHTDKIW